MAAPLVVLAPHTIGNEGLITRNPSSPLAQQSPLGARKARHRFGRCDGLEPQELRPTLGAFARNAAEGWMDATLSSATTLASATSPKCARLPPVGVKRAYPQTFKDILAYSRPAQWPWMEEEEDEDSESEDSPRKSLAASSSAPVMGYMPSEVPEPRRRSVRSVASHNDPESMLSPFALQARRFGADVVITGQRLRPGSGTLLKWRLDGGGSRPASFTGEAGDGAGTPAEAQDAQLRRSASAASDGRRPKRRQPRPREPFRVGIARPPPPQTSPPTRMKRPPSNAPPQRQQPPRQHGVSSRELAGLDQSADQGVQRPASGAENVFSMTMPQNVNAPDDAIGRNRLPAGPAGLWEGISELKAVRELHDIYAADPLGWSPPRRPGERPSSANGFLEKYVERQAEIERMLQERMGSPASPQPRQ
mmetsp:Transcript_1830/g.5440  ORF Transcript_1830/g.5440 Transcript_1830/m.5440 type:complete len:421 (-) Transcript_1830:426-1688(-)